jgi:HPt (histidine-containing phosphotransfer) domain-containing protein
MKEQKTTNFSLDLLIEVAQQDEGFIREMISLFLKTASITLEEINLNFKKGDFVQCGEKAHKLKSSVQIIGDEELHQLVKKIEKEAKTGDSNSELKLLIPKLNTKMEQLIHFLTNRLDDTTEFS